MQINNRHLFSFLVHRNIKKLVKTNGLDIMQFEVLVLCKYIYERSNRPVYIRDIHLLLYNASWMGYKLTDELTRLGYVVVEKKRYRRAGKPRIEVSLSHLGNELLEKVRLASESRIACIKHQLDSERSKVNSISKKRIKKVA